jgi:hypothetical protein
MNSTYSCKLVKDVELRSSRPPVVLQSGAMHSPALMKGARNSSVLQHMVVWLLACPNVSTQLQAGKVTAITTAQLTGHSSTQKVLQKLQVLLCCYQKCWQL